MKAVLLYRVLGQHGHADLILDLSCAEIICLEGEGKADTGADAAIL